MCFAIVVGKRASQDGSVLLGHNEQNLGRNIIHYRRIPRRQAQLGELVRLYGGGAIEQVPETYSYLWTESPGLEFSDNCINEWGVAITMNGCPTREDSVQEVIARGDIKEGGLGYLLPRLLAERAQTARQAVDIAGDLVTRCGYTGSGRTAIVADPNEAWVIAFVRGHHFVAQRVPDDAVVLLPNTHIIGADTDLNDKDNVVASRGLVAYATKRGWYDQSSGEPFSFKAAFSLAPAGSMEEAYGICSRQWQTQALVSGQRADLPPIGPLPFAVHPTHKYAVQDVAAILRSHLEDTEFDLTKLQTGGSPHEPEDAIDASFARCACNIATQESVIFQLRSWLPRSIGCVAWRANSVPCTSVYTPWYVHHEEVPKLFHDGADLQTALSLEHHFQPNQTIFQPNEQAAFWPFYQIAHAVNADYARLAPRVRQTWAAFENEELKVQEAVEQIAMDFMQEDAAAARRWLTDYSIGRALQALEKARELALANS
jgi:dipeptidase